MRLVARSVIALLIVGPLALGCGETDPNTAQYWIDRLDGTDIKIAAVKLAEMKAPEAVEPLMEAFKTGRYRYEVVAALAQLGDKRAEPLMLEALQDHTDAKTAQLAGSTLLDWGADKFGDIYLKVARDPQTPKEARLAAMELLAEYPIKEAKQTLIAMLNQDPDLQPIIFNGLAAETLGKLGEPEAVDGLIHCLWLDDHLHRNEVSRCRLALNRIGPEAAVPALIATLEGKNKRVQKRARKFHFDKGGLIQAKCAELLGDMPDARAVEPLTTAIMKFDVMTPDIQNDPTKSQGFVMAELQKVISIANALATIGDERGVKPLMEIAIDANAALEHKLTSVQQVAFLGSQSAVKPMFELLANDPHPKDPVSNGFRLQVALNLGNLLDGMDRKAVDKFDRELDRIIAQLAKWSSDLKTEMQKAPKESHGGLKRDLKAYRDWTKGFEKAKQKVVALRDCKDDVACWGKKLDSKIPSAIRMQAAYRLAQRKDARESALQQLVPYIGDEDLVFRNVILFGLSRLGDPSIIPAVEKARAADAERAKKNKNLRGAVYTMDLMLAKLSHKKK